MITKKTQDNLLSRLNRIEGQVKGVRKMVENVRYCPDILNQIVAVRRALDSVSLKILSDHMNTCVSNAIRKDKGRASIDELIQAIDRFVR